MELNTQNRICNNICLYKKIVTKGIRNIIDTVINTGHSTPIDSATPTWINLSALRINSATGVLKPIRGTKNRTEISNDETRRNIVCIL